MVGRKTTLEDVARMAGVSLATVDRVLNGRGGVSAVKEELILSAARRLRLDRSLARRPQRMLRVAVLIQAPTNPFHAALKLGLDLAARLHADLNIQFLVHHVVPTDAAATAALIAGQAERCDGLIVTVPDEPAIAQALHAAAQRRPVVTLATDIASSGRAAYVGPDDRRAGRVAGDLIGRLLGSGGGRIAMIAGLRSLTGHREREAGLRAVLAEFHPHVALAAVIESGEDAARAGELVLEAFAADPALCGLYHTSAGALPAVMALRRLGRERTTVFVTHELTDDRRQLLRGRAIDAVIDQQPELEARMAVETMARLLGRLDGPIGTVLTDVRVHMPENA